MRTHLKLVSLLFLSLLLNQCQPGAKARPNIILITLDTTRADALGAYGNSWAVTPVIDRLAATGHLFGNCLSQAPITLPAHASIMTGLIPPHHGVRNNGTYQLQQKTTLAETLQNNGYATGAFVGSVILARQYGLAKGFLHYDDDVVHYTETTESHIVTRRAETVISRALSWMKQTQKPFFSWLHLYDAHWPYDPPSPFKEAYADQPYLGELAYLDLQLGRLIHQLKQQGLWDNTLLVLTADHGESLGEHGEDSHGFFAYSATTHVPLILSGPLVSQPGRRIEHLVRSIDIMPTLLDLLKLPHPDGLDGLNLYQNQPRSAYAEAMIPFEGMYCSPVQALNDGAFSYYHAGQDELYDLKADPKEQDNLIKQLPEVATRMQTVLDQIPLQQGSDSGFQIDQSTIELLRSLGYVHDGGSHSPSVSEPFALPSPRSSLAVYKGHQDLRQLGKSFPFKAIEGYRKLQEKHPEHVLLKRELGTWLTQANQQDEALKQLRSAAQQWPEDPRLHTVLGLALAHFGHFEKSLEEFTLALELDPQHYISRYNAALILLKTNQIEAAQANFQQCLQQKPDDVLVLNNLAVISLDHEQKPQQAMDYLNRALSLAPNHPLLRRNAERVKKLIAP